MQSITSTRDISFDNSYATMAPEFFARLDPTPVSQPRFIAVNEALAARLGIDADWLKSDAGLAMLSGNEVAAGSEPIAMAYAGHQFGQWVPQLGDGRALLLGEVIDQTSTRYDIQLKGAGRTPFSRGGDGRNWIGPVLREYVVSEAMAALGVPTTRALAAVVTGDHIMREQGLLPGAILTRVARGHIRVGTFQYFAARENRTALEQLTRYVIDRHYPQVATHDNPVLSLLDAIIEAQASLIAQWQSLGFIHGVMNTDNCSISGDTIDYGPCAFMDTYVSDKVFSSIDRGARYAYRNQPRIAQWNLANLAQCLLPLLHEEPETALQAAQTSINRFVDSYAVHYLSRMRAKLGLIDSEHSEHSEGDPGLIDQLLTLLQEHELDFTLSFRQLTRHVEDDPFTSGGPLNDWYQSWQSRVERQPGGQAAAHERMMSCNPAIIPRNHQVEAMIDAAVRSDDFTRFHELLKAVTTPFDRAHDDGIFAEPPAPDEVVTQTFCGT